MANADIKTMKLYLHLDRVYNELRELGRSDTDTLQAEELAPFDQLHYRGTTAVDDAINAAGVGMGTSILEIGSGLGGPARHIAHTVGASVTALELQEDQHKLAVELTARCGLSDKIAHVCGDFLSYEWAGQTFDVIASWLALYHIPQRNKLLARCHDLLNPGGVFYAEDLFCRRLFSDDEWAELSAELYAQHLPDFDRYRLDLKNAGFDSIACQDMSEDWSEFTRERMTTYREQKARHLRVHGEDIFASLDAFYDVVVRYFSSGKLGGIRIIASKI
ncbi:MAG: class I SAM-dependent methyltransferase [Arenicellales bacterium]|jgi:cyclopropane fatty-acyl-phospholipid synthase-like methyltransferase|nr:class I SAM-dependent methyltransferase [Arenicellales bacterium]